MSGEVQISIGRKLVNGEVLTYSTIQDILDSLTAAVLAGSLTARELADGTIPESKLSTAVRSQLGLPDGTVTTAKLADGCLTADATGRAKMADGYITTAKIADAQITAAKLVSSLTWPVGMIAGFGGESAPTGWLECNGAAISRSTYSALFASYGGLWGAGNGSTTFNIPDLRGYFLRGWDNGAGNDPNANARTGGDHVGSSQTDGVKAHSHTIYTLTGFSGAGSAYVYVTSGGTETAAVTATTGAESRPKNKNVMFCCKY